MTPTQAQLARRRRSFSFNHNGQESWFYLDDRCSFHQSPRTNTGRQQDVFGPSVVQLIRALEACGYIPKQTKVKR